MKIRTTSLMITLICISASACWVKPPEYVVLQASPCSEYFIRKINSQSVVEVRKCEDLSLDWQTKIDGYSDLFSIIKIPPNGGCVVHVKGNHLINARDQICVEIYPSEGAKITFDVTQIQSQLVEVESNLSTAPAYKWFKEVSNISDSKIVIRLDEKKYAWIDLQTKRVEIHQ